MTGETISLGIRCPRSLNDKLQAIAEAAGKNKSQLILEYIKAGVEGENPKTLAADLEALQLKVAGLEALRDDSEELQSKISKLELKLESVVKTAA